MRLEGLEIARWAHGGDAVAIPSEGPLAGMIVFLNTGVPGDVVSAEVVTRKKRWARAVVVSVERESPHRVSVPCTIQAECGGCRWMSGSPTVQGASRLAILQGEAKKRLGWEDQVVAERVSLAESAGPSLGYRCRVRLGYRVGPGGEVTLGFRAPRSHKLIDLTRCAVAAPDLSDALDTLRDIIAQGPEGEGELRLISGQEGVSAWGRGADGEVWSWGPERVTIMIGDERHWATPKGFFQANPVVTEGIRQAALVALGEPTTPEAHAVELFAGSGTFTVGLLRAGYRVTAYEVDRSSEPLFRANTEGVGEATFHTTDLLDSGVPLPAPAAPEVVFLDPPRQGASPLMPWIRACGARRVVLVSCDVSTAMRDLQALQGAYEVLSVTGWDMFPHTGHQEVIAVLQRI